MRRIINGITNSTLSALKNLLSYYSYLNFHPRFLIFTDKYTTTLQMKKIRLSNLFRSHYLGNWICRMRSKKQQTEEDHGSRSRNSSCSDPLVLAFKHPPTSMAVESKSHTSSCAECRLCLCGRLAIMQWISSIGMATC